MHDVSFNVQFFKEGDVFVAHVPEFDVSSCGDTKDLAAKNILDAVRGFLETADEMGTLEEIMQESGYRRSGEGWQGPELVSLENQTLHFA